MFGCFRRQFKPISIKSKKIIGKNEQYDTLWDIEIKLNRKPDMTWIEFYKNPRSFTSGISPSDVTGKVIIKSCEENTIESTYEWIGKYIDQANEKYLKLIKDDKKQKEIEKMKNQEEEEETKKLRKKFD